MAAATVEEKVVIVITHIVGKETGRSRLKGSQMEGLVV